MDAAILVASLGNHPHSPPPPWYIRMPQALGERSAGDPPSRTHGVAYLVPDDKAEQVLAGLDFREKGGYTRATVDVFPTGDGILALAGERRGGSGRCGSCILLY